MSWQDKSDKRGLYFVNSSYGWEPEDKLPEIIDEVIDLFKKKLLGKGHDVGETQLLNFVMEVNCNSGRLFFIICNGDVRGSETLSQGCEVHLFCLQDFVDSLSGLSEDDFNKSFDAKVVSIGKQTLQALRTDGSFKSMNFIVYGEEETPEFQEVI